MRTLKKTLCLILALVMVLGMSAVNVAAADFTDKADIKYTEAVNVMRIAKVLDGMPDGSFNPDGTLTRAQAAKMIACMMGMGTLKGTASFTDTKGHWAESYIAFCAKEGIVDGNGDGTFAPDATLTGSQWAKMVIGAIGYNAAAEGISGTDWEIAVAKMVKKLGLTGAIKDFDGTKQISRQEASELGFQGMKAGTVKYTPGMKINGVEIAGTTTAPVDGVNLLKALNIVPAVAADLSADDFGRPAVSGWKSTVPGVGVLYTTYATPLATVDGATLDTDTIAKTACLKDGVSAVSSLTIVTNGNSATAAPSTLKQAGAQVEFYSTEAAKPTVADTAVVIKYEPAKVKAIDAKTGKVTLTISGSDVDVVAPADGEAATTQTSKNHVAVKGFAKDDVLAICRTGSTTTLGKILDVVKAGTVEGKVTAAKKESTTLVDVTVNGTKYTVASTFDFDAIDTTVTGLDIGSEGTLYLAPNGAVISCIGKAAVNNDTFVYVIDNYKTAEANAYGYDTKWFVQAVNMAGETVSYPVAEANKIADAAKKTLKKLVADTTPGNAGLYKFENIGASLTENATTVIAATDKKITGTSNYFTSDVKFIFVENSLNTLKVTVKDGVQAVATGTKVSYVTKDVAGTSNKTISAVFVGTGYTAPTVTTSGVAFLLGDSISGVASYAKDKDGKEVVAYTKSIYIDGVKTDILVDLTHNVANANGFYTVSKDGDLTVLTAAPGTATNLMTGVAVTGIYNSMLSASASSLDDVTVSAEVKIIDLRTNGDITALADVNGRTVALVADKAPATPGAVISIIYITA